MGRVNYDQYWDSKAQSGLGILSPWRLKRAQVFASLVQPGDHVLDLGVGDGALLRYMIEAGGIIGYGLDVSQKAVDFCRTQRLNVALADINRPVGQAVAACFQGVNRFDYIILSEIIEHLPDAKRLAPSLSQPRTAWRTRYCLTRLPHWGHFRGA